MGLPVKEQLRWWGVGLAALIVVMWFLNTALLPFIAGAAVAYFLDPVADRLEALGCSRVVATLMISTAAIFTFILLGLILIPILVEQTGALVNAAPTFTTQVQELLQRHLPSLMEADSPVRATLDAIGETIRSKGGALVNTVLVSAVGVLDALVFMVVVPVVAFYLLLDWDRMVAAIDSWLPREHASTIRLLARRVDGVLAGFVRGQLTVCVILGVFYSVLLMLVGLQFGLVVGLFAGAITFIPYVGATFGGVLAIGLALFQFWNEPWWIGAVALIFVTGQILEGNIISPNLVGKSVGLHPVWLMFSLAAFGSLFGFAGLLVAVPVAATLGVFFRFGVEQYLASALYRGPKSKGNE